MAGNSSLKVAQHDPAIGGSNLHIAQSALDRARRWKERVDAHPEAIAVAAIESWLDPRSTIYKAPAAVIVS